MQKWVLMFLCVMFPLTSWAVGGQSLRFVTVLSSPVGSFNEVNQELSSEHIGLNTGATVNIGHTSSQGGEVSLKGMQDATASIETLQMADGTTLGIKKPDVEDGRNPVWQIENGLTIGEGANVTVGSLIGNVTLTSTSAQLTASNEIKFAQKIEAKDIAVRNLNIIEEETDSTFIFAGVEPPDTPASVAKWESVSGYKVLCVNCH